MIDLSILEPILMVLGPQPVYYDQLGIVPPRTGNRSTSNAPRNTYRTRDGRWVAVSTSANTIAERVMRLVGHPEVIEEPWFAAGSERVKHADELDGMVGGWIAERDRDQVLAEFEAAGAAIAPIYDIADIMSDPQLAALRTMVAVEDPDLGRLRMQGVAHRMSDTPGQVRFTGRNVGQDNEAVYSAIGRDPAQLRAEGTI
jgi:crotonobetainyl-CoA:carnitine CoA-transferase CaiB-like acyl-CoA transferase